MKVKKLIHLLSTCDPEAKVEVDGFDTRGEVTSIEETFYNSPSNNYVEIFSGLSEEPSQYQVNMKELSELRSILSKVRILIN